MARGSTQANHSKYAGQNLEQVQTLVRAQVVERVKALLDGDTDEAMDLQAPLMEMGLDSLATTQLVRQLGEDLGVTIAPTLLFDYPTVAALSGYLASLVSTADVERDVGPDQSRQARPISHAAGAQQRGVALIGMSCRLPGSIDNTAALWTALTEGRCAVGKVPFRRWDVEAAIASKNSLGKEVQNRMRWGGFVEDLELFDPSFFRISAAEADAMDPQQRLLLEYSWLAFRDAGYTKEMLQDQNAGVFLGIASNDAVEVSSKAAGSATSVYSANGTSHSTAVGRVSYTFGLQGPCAAYDTACSSTLVALHAGVRALQNGDCDLALVGAVNVMLTATISEAFAVAGMTSPTGRCHTFDEAADGYVRGEGCGAVVLKRMDEAALDRDRIHAVVTGVGVAQDGTSASLTAPNGRAQEKLLRSTLADGELAADELDYLEAHGTGTALGDPIEMSSAASVFGEGRGEDGPLVMGAVKANIGHLEPAAGMAGLIKTVLVMQHKQAPSNPELRSLNPKIEAVVESFPVRFPVESEPLRARSRDESLTAGVSSFGYAGTIAHALVTQASGEVARDVPEACEGSSETLFLFTGQGSQYEGMGQGLYQNEPVFCTALDRCEVEFASITGESLLEVVRFQEKRGGEVAKHDDGARTIKILLDQTQYTQPALFALEWSLAELWRSRGVVPGAVLGHSVGEIVAACVAGITTMETGMQLVVQRSRLTQVGRGGGKGGCVMGFEECERGRVAPVGA